MNFLAALVAVTVVATSAVAMTISEDTGTCSELDRGTLGAIFDDDADDFVGQVTVIYNVAPPKPWLTRQVFHDRDPIFYNRIQYDEQIDLYHNLYERFRSQDMYRNKVRFLLSASLHRVPYEPLDYNFEEFFDNVTTLASDYNITVYPNPLTDNGTFELFGLMEFQAYVVDPCVRVAYIIKPPWSLIQYSYVKAAVLSTLYDRPCGKCEFENFLNSTLSDGAAENRLTSAVPNTKPYEDSDETHSSTSSDYSVDSKYLVEEDNGYMLHHQQQQEQDETVDRELLDALDNFNVTGPDLVIPLRIILPVKHIHASGTDADIATRHRLFHYIVLHSNDTDFHGHSDPMAADSGAPVELREVSLTAANGSLRIIDTDWPYEKLRTVLNTTVLLYDDNGRVAYERLKRYNLTTGLQYDEVEQVPLASRYAAWNRRQVAKVQQARIEKRFHLQRHYERLLQWVNWQFGKIPPRAGDP